MPGPLQDIEALLSERIGLDPKSVGSSLVSRAVELRMGELGLQTFEGYLSRLGSSATELQALIEEVIVPESWFFRDVAPFNDFQEYVRARWLSHSERESLRVLSIPCAGGEEPFSIVIALLEIGLSFARFHVDAVDVSLRRLDDARRGVFSQNAFRGSNLTFRDRYFQVHPRGFELAPTVRAGVRFLQGSILDSGLLVGETPYDVIFCRNLLIYLDRLSRLQVMTTLDRLLATNGHLVLGHADRVNLSGNLPGFCLVGEPRAFTYRRAVALPPAKVREALPSPRKWSESAVDCRPETDPFKGAPDRLLERAGELANLGRSVDAIRACEQHLRATGPSAAAYYLLGVLHQSQGNRSRGEAYFQKAVYLDPGHDEALLALAVDAERRGDVAAAMAFRRRAKKALARKGAR